MNPRRSLLGRPSSLTLLLHPSGGRSRPTAKKPCILTAAIIIALSCFGGPAQARTDNAYIMVHAHNPEGVEVTTIEPPGRFPVQLYIDDTFLGLQEEFPLNGQIAIPPGTHTVTAVFNGMAKTETVTLEAGQTRVLEFTFERTEFDLAGWLNSIGTSQASLSRSGTWTASGLHPWAWTEWGKV